MVLTRWATIRTVASTTSSASGGAKRRVGRVVEGREGVVEEIDAGSMHDRSSDGQTLALPSGEIGPALGDRRVETIGHRLAESSCLGDLEHPPQLLIGGVGHAVAQIG